MSSVVQPAGEAVVPNTRSPALSAREPLDSGAEKRDVVLDVRIPAGDLYRIPDPYPFEQADGPPVEFFLQGALRQSPNPPEVQVEVGQAQGSASALEVGPREAVRLALAHFR